MTYLLAQFWPWVLLCCAIGLGTGWWIWRADAVAEPAVEPPWIPPAPPEDAAFAPEPLPEEPLLDADDEDDAPSDAKPDLLPWEVKPFEEAEMADAPPVAPVEPDTIEPPAPETPSPFLDAPEGEPDDLTRIKGVGPKLHDMLHAIGVYHFRQIAEWSDADIATVDARLDTFQGRITRDRWVEQARYLADNDMVAFRREFGKPRGEL